MGVKTGDGFVLLESGIESTGFSWCIIGASLEIVLVVMTGW